ncbi:hypothetical protein BZA05DRAFT_421384 [Tricharina praecox]|uniref:uncharacterized protein n=1 Tax=Tricharina praecox TaxID=43433 RepID=UPI00221EAD3F|nr:uncharacterized protein BZA05DRAFT_421384 [Tricharina praecox]KAI5845558.1 hypothetical protein BZA05DRAFT_421384 [Tricharina praecox]
MPCGNQAPVPASAMPWIVGGHSPTTAHFYISTDDFRRLPPEERVLFLLHALDLLEWQLNAFYDDIARANWIRRARHIHDFLDQQDIAFALFKLPFANADRGGAEDREDGDWEDGDQEGEDPSCCALLLIIDPGYRVHTCIELEIVQSEDRRLELEDFQKPEAASVFKSVSLQEPIHTEDVAGAVGKHPASTTSSFSSFTHQLNHPSSIHFTNHFPSDINFTNQFPLDSNRRINIHPTTIYKMTSMNPLLSSGRTSCEPEFTSPSPDHTNNTAAAEYIRSTADIKNLYAVIVRNTIVAAAAYRARAILNAYSPATPKRAHAEPVSDAAITARYYSAVTSVNNANAIVAANDAIAAAYYVPAPPGFVNKRIPPGFSLEPSGIMKLKLAYNRCLLVLGFILSFCNNILSHKNNNKQHSHFDHLNNTTNILSDEKTATAILAANRAAAAIYHVRALPGFVNKPIPPGISYDKEAMEYVLAYNRWQLGLDPLPPVVAK